VRFLNTFSSRDGNKISNVVLLKCSMAISKGKDDPAFTDEEHIWGQIIGKY
jgi:hypothetical protein